MSVADSTNRRLIESITSQLGLRPVVAAADEVVDLVAKVSPSMIVADEKVARGLRDMYIPSPASADNAPPALVAVLSAASGEEHLPDTRAELPYNGVLVLPQPPSTVLAQLSVSLYAHRAYIERLESAMELQLDRRIFKSVTSGVSVASALEEDFPLVYVNPAFEVMTGYSLEEIQGKNCRFLQGAHRDQPGLTLIREALKERRETLAIVRNYKKDGTPFWNELSLSPIRDREGRVTHFVGIQQDVTERVAFEDALRESEKLAALGRLAASIAHEINNPLATVTNLIYLARHEADTEQRSMYLDVAGEELNRVTLLTNQSLRFYQQSTKPTEVRLGDLVSEVIDLYSVKMMNLNIVLQRKYRPYGRLACLESELRQVVSNLLRNAIEAIESTCGRLLVRLREATHWQNGARGVLLTIADTGSGMSEETKARLYTAFHTTKEQSGTGLGLWVSKEIIDRHHGSIRVRSRRGSPSGTVFTVFLPYRP
ncbi:MAG: two-component system sensor histidine kinase NtrB [Janthinobacterium lividum]